MVKLLRVNRHALLKLKAIVPVNRYLQIVALVELCGIHPQNRIR